MRFRLRAFYQPFALIFTHCNGVFPGKGTIYLSEGTLGKKEGFLFSREAFLFSNGAFLFSNGASIFGCRKCRKCTALFLPPKLSVGPRVCVLLSFLFRFYSCCRRAIYLPMMSNSRLTTVPTRMSWKLVCSMV